MAEDMVEDSKKISDLPNYAGGVERAVQDNAMLPVAIGNVSNAKIGMKALSVYMSQLTNSNRLVPGANIQINSNNVISATDTVYDDAAIWARLDEIYTELEAEIAGMDAGGGGGGGGGEAATVEVGTTETGSPGSDASVTNSGTSHAAVLDFVIPRGLQGPPGQSGQPGTPGAPGQPGQDGVGVNILGSYETKSNLLSSQPTGNPGDGYMVLNDPNSGNNGLYIWDALNNTWRWVGNIRGPKGADGATFIGVSPDITNITTLLGWSSSVPGAPGGQFYGVLTNSVTIQHNGFARVHSFGVILGNMEYNNSSPSFTNEEDYITLTRDANTYSIEKIEAFIHISGAAISKILVARPSSWIPVKAGDTITVKEYNMHYLSSQGISQNRRIEFAPYLETGEMGGGYDDSEIMDILTVSPSRLLGRYSSSAGMPQEITLGSNLSLDSNGVLSASGGGGGGGIAAQTRLPQNEDWNNHTTPGFYLKQAVASAGDAPNGPPYYTAGTGDWSLFVIGGTDGGATGSNAPAAPGGCVQIARYASNSSITLFFRSNGVAGSSNGAGWSAWTSLPFWGGFNTGTNSTLKNPNNILTPGQYSNEWTSNLPSGAANPLKGSLLVLASDIAETAANRQQILIDSAGGGIWYRSTASGAWQPFSSGGGGGSVSWSEITGKPTIPTGGNLASQSASFGQLAQDGFASTFARSDHYHALPPSALGYSSASGSGSINSYSRFIEWEITGSNQILDLYSKPFEDGSFVFLRIIKNINQAWNSYTNCYIRVRDDSGAAALNLAVGCMPDISIYPNEVPSVTYILMKAWGKLFGWSRFTSAVTTT